MSECCSCLGCIFSEESLHKGSVVPVLRWLAVVGLLVRSCGRPGLSLQSVDLDTCSAVFELELQEVEPGSTQRAAWVATSLLLEVEEVHVREPCFGGPDVDGCVT